MDMTDILSIWDWSALGVFALSYFGYHRVYHWIHRRWDLHLRLDECRELLDTVQNNVQQPEGRVLLSNIFRGYSRTFIFLGMISFLALSGALGLIASSEQTHALLNFSQIEVSRPIANLRVRLAIFIGLAGYALLQFLWGLKALFNLSYVMHGSDAERIREYLQYMDMDLTNGIRTLYYLSVLFLWLFGPEFFAVGTVVLTVFLYRYDFMKTPY